MNGSMTNGELIAMCREVADLCAEDPHRDGLITLNLDEMRRLVERVAELEREACAQVCREIMDDFWTGDPQWEVARNCAESIRSRSEA